MKAIILAAGRGSRMKDLTDECPKCLLKVRGKTLLQWQTDALLSAGIRDIGIVTGYKRELLAGTGLIEFHNSRWAETNMVSSLTFAEDWLQSDVCIVSYSDIFYEKEAVVSLIQCPELLAVTYDPHWLKLWEKRFGDPLIDAETFRLNADNSLAEIGNKPQSIDEIQGQYMGLLRFTPNGWNEVVRIRKGLSSQDRDRMHMTGTLQRVLDEGRLPIAAVPYESSWGEVDTTEDLVGYN